MLKTENTNMNINGSIYSDNVTLAAVNGNFHGANDCYINISIPDWAATAENRAVFYADLETFIDQLLATITDLQDNGAEETETEIEE